MFGHVEHFDLFEVALAQLEQLDGWLGSRSARHAAVTGSEQGEGRCQAYQLH